jgi:hypothetical protein
MAKAEDERFAGVKVAISFVLATATLLTALTAFLGVIPSLGLFNQGDGKGGLIPGVGVIQKAQEPSPQPSETVSQPGTTIPPVSRPVIYLSQTSSPAGGQVFVSGEGFRKGAVTIQVHTYDVATTEVEESGQFKNVAITIPVNLGKFAPLTVTVTARDTASRWATKQIVVSG